MGPEYRRPELDDPLPGEMESSHFRMLTAGSAQLAITLGRMYIQYGTTMLASFNMCPREGHLNPTKKLVGYLKGHLKGEILFDKRIKLDNVEEFGGSNWRQTYGDLNEELPPDMPKLKMKPIQLAIYFDASHACDVVTL